MAHFIHYHRRIVAASPTPTATHLWYARKQARTHGFDAPRFHITRATSGPAALIDEKDTIWLVSQLQSATHPPGPIALDARIEVARVHTRDPAAPGTWQFRYTAGPGSRWFPLFDLGDRLHDLHSVVADDTTRPLLRAPDQHPGGALRRIRHLASANALQDLEQRIDAAPLHFVSYRTLDGTWPAFDLARHLSADRGVAVWWDRWSLPRRLAERREEVSSDSLSCHISRVIARADTVWGVETDRYDEPGSYSATEKAMAQRRGVYRPA